MLLAVVLCFSTLPFSVSADELPGELSTESTVETQPEEYQAEDPTPSGGEILDNSPSENGSITISDSSGDVPVLYAQDPFNTVKSEVEGGTNYMTSVGVTRESIVRELEAHEDDNYYLGTPYAGGDAQSPNGDASYNSGTVGMNCAGFISYVLRKAGLDAETTMEIMHRTPVNQYGSGLPYDWLAGASNYKNLVENGNISAYAFRTKQELLSSGLAEKGDIILMWWSNSPGADGADNHIGFFWGEASDDDVMWHSGTEPSSGNQISEITPKTPGSFYILIKIEPLQPKDYQVTLTKTSADVSITQGNSAYSLAGATYNVYEGTSGTGSVVATFTTDEAGHATLSTPLEDGTYSVKEVTPPKGYKLDEKIYTFTINGGDTSLSVEDEPGTLTLKLKKKDSQTGSTPQGNASLAGAVYQVSYQKGGQTVTEELTSDASGNLGTLEGIPFGTVTVKELTDPEGYRLDTEVHTYTVDGSQLTGDVYELEVDDLTEDVMRGGLSIQKLDSQAGTTPQGDASLEGIQFEIVNQSANPVVVNGNSVLGRVMDRLDTFDHGKHIDRYYLNQDFGFPKYDCTGFCGDYVRGVLRGVPMEFCEFELQEKHVTEDKDGDTDVSYETVFYGVIVVCRHNLALSDAVMATQFKTYENAYNADSEAFYNAFSVRCTSEQDAKLALTPDYMQKLLELSAERGKRFAIRFLQDGTLLLVIKDMNLFEMGKSENTVQLVEKLEKEMEDFINILDTGSHPPIISREMYEQAQRLKESRFSETRRAPHTFTHRIQCPSCGRFYRHINSSGTSKWACPNQVNKVKDCPNYWISETTIKLAFLNMAGKLYCHHEFLLITTIKLLEEIAAQRQAL